MSANLNALNAGEVNTTLEYYAEGVKFEVIGITPEQRITITSKTQLRILFEEFTTQHSRFEVDILNAKGNYVTTKILIWSDLTRRLGVAPLVATDQYLINNSKITRIRRTIHPESAAKLLSALTHIQE
ncbi:MAG: hypothetical protein A2Y88_02320 [Chloroflexi bacterium RBG_13_48_10]|nr:MAG: hypothetical protein A2Y88_02320 [Chloroflexi bacterium RBG_13_48_10]